MSETPAQGNDYPLASLKVEQIRSNILHNTISNIRNGFVILALITGLLLVLNAKWDGNLHIGTDKSAGATFATPKKGGSGAIPDDIKNGISVYAPEFPEVRWVDPSCNKRGIAWIDLGKITPNGALTVQVDWTSSGTFGYPNTYYADPYGHATVPWSCFDSMGWLVPDNAYGVLFTDSTTGLARAITITTDAKQNVVSFSKRYNITY